MSDKDIGTRIKNEPELLRLLELLSQAEELYKDGKDPAKRTSYINFDGSIEMSILTYVKHDPESKEQYKELLVGKKTTFYQKLEVLEKIVKNDKNLAMKYDIGTINDYHKLRNKLQHENGPPPNSTELEKIREIAIWVFETLFEIDIKYYLIKQGRETSFLIATILGGWSEKYQGDNDIIRRLLNRFDSLLDFNTWQNDIKKIKTYNNDVLSLVNGCWQVSNKESVLVEYAQFFYDDRLDLIKSIFIEVLSERHPMFDLNPGERLMASMRGKVPRYSPELRKGISETLVFLSINSAKLENCSLHKPEAMVNATIREIFENSDWKLWASLGDILPILAEASPSEFLTAVKKALDQEPCPFDELYKQGGKDITSRPYMAELYWALEILAWSEEYLSESILFLAGLARHDPGGQWTNCPANSITNILLPWCPQTTANVEDRIGALKAITLRAIKRRDSDIAWKILLSLLPNPHQKSYDSCKPRYRKFIPDDWKDEVSHEEYEEQTKASSTTTYSISRVSRNEYEKQIKKCSLMAFEMAKGNIEYISELVENLENIPKPTYKGFLKYLREEIGKLSDKQKQPIWENMTSLIRKHKRNSDTGWALSKNEIGLLEETAKKLEPENVEILYRYLFSNKYMDIVEERTDWETQEKIIRAMRIEALEKIYSISRTESIISFARKVDEPSIVGYSFSEIAREETDNKFLPVLLDHTESFYKQFIGSYVYGRYDKNKHSWLEGLNILDWTDTQRCNLLISLPFESEIWQKVDELLGVNSGDYWRKVITNPLTSKSSLLPAVKNLLKHNRPLFALECIYAHYHSKKELLREQAIKALQAIKVLNEYILRGQNVEDNTYHISTYNIIEIIKALQNTSDVRKDELCEIEWQYLPLLKRHNEAEPRFLEERLSQEPEFFVEIIQLIYSSKKEKEQKQKVGGQTKRLAKNAWELLHKFFVEIIQLIYSSKKEKEQRQKVDEQKRHLTENAWELLHNWRSPPGKKSDASFSAKELRSWYESVKTKTIESGHYEVAMQHLGHVLFYSGEDESGLWINRPVADLLDEKENEKMRQGFVSEVCNSRGVYSVDPSGESEKELARHWRARAKEVKREGLAYFASSLEKLANHYEDEADYVVKEEEYLNKE